MDTAHQPHNKADIPAAAAVVVVAVDLEAAIPVGVVGVVTAVAVVVAAEVREVTVDRFFSRKKKITLLAKLLPHWQYYYYFNNYYRYSYASLYLQRYFYILLFSLIAPNLIAFLSSVYISSRKKKN